jgi:tetratricopeptide (TPR) repeat protein
MATPRFRSLLLLFAAFAGACASAEDRLNEGIALQSQGRYIQAVYRYADAVEKDRTLTSARERLRAAGDSAVMVTMDDADALERRGDPVQAAARYVELDRMLNRVREVGERIDLPRDYAAIRRGVFDHAIEWQMAQGDEAAADGRWQDARGYYTNARANYLPSREQVEESFDAETRLMLDWAEVDLEDGYYRSAYERAGEALEVRASPARETVLAVRDLQDRALAAGTVVLAVVPVTAEPDVRDWLGGEFEVQLDSDLGLDHWTRPPPFVQMADPLLLRSELRGLLRGRAVQSPMLVGRALELIGADLGVMIRIAHIEVVEEGVDRDTHTTVVTRNVRGGTPLVSTGAIGVAYARSDRPEVQLASGQGNSGRGPGEEGNNGRGPPDAGDPETDRCGNNGRGPQDTGNNGRGPGDNGRPCPDEDADTRGADTDAGSSGGGTDTSGGGRPGDGENRRSGPEGRGMDPTVSGNEADPAGRRGVAVNPPTTVSDTVSYTTVRGTLTYYVEAEIILVDVSGREVNRFTASSRQSGPFERGEFVGDPRTLRLPNNHVRFFDPAVLSGQMSTIERAVLDELAVSVATGTYDQVLAGIR